MAIRFGRTALNVEIRLMARADVPAVVALEHREFRDGLTAEEVHRACRGRTPLVAVAHGRVIGWLVYEERADRRELITLTVDREYHGQGIGRELVKLVALSCRVGACRGYAGRVGGHRGGGRVPEGVRVAGVRVRGRRGAVRVRPRRGRVMGVTGIEWTNRTWNPVVGCTKVSTGCKNCYAKTLHDLRHKAHGAGKAVPAQYAKPFEEVQLMPERLRAPLSWKKPQRVFVNSVSDLFHEDVPDQFLDRVFAVMALAKQHTFQVLTKRAERMKKYITTRLRIESIYDQWHEFSGDPREADAWPLPNVWLGVSVENQAAADERIPHLLKTPAAVRFLSCEPLLGKLKLMVVGTGPQSVTPLHPDERGAQLSWVIVGGESGPGARPMEVGWARSIVEQCGGAGVPVFVKQDSGPKPGQQGRIPLDVWQHKEFPEVQ